MRQLIIDGYNVILQATPYSKLAERDDFELACEALISDAASFVGPQYKVTVVYDGTGNKFSTGEPRKIAGVTVIYSPYGQTADTVIERLAHEYRDRGDDVEVVTSDEQTQRAVMGERIVRRSSREFIEELGVGYSEFAENKESAPYSKVTLDQRISADAVELLRKIRDGEA